MNEYTNTSTGGPTHTYTSLGAYNQGMGAGAMAPVPVGTPNMNYQVVPVYGSFGYDTLKHGQKNTGGARHFNIGSAYPAYPNGCNNFTARLTEG